MWEREITEAWPSKYLSRMLHGITVLTRVNNIPHVLSPVKVGRRRIRVISRHGEIIEIWPKSLRRDLSRKVYEITVLSSLNTRTLQRINQWCVTFRIPFSRNKENKRIIISRHMNCTRIVREFITEITEAWPNLVYRKFCANVRICGELSEDAGTIPPIIHHSTSTSLSILLHITSHHFTPLYQYHHSSKTTHNHSAPLRTTPHHSKLSTPLHTISQILST